MYANFAAGEGGEESLKLVQYGRKEVGLSPTCKSTRTSLIFRRLFLEVIESQEQLHNENSEYEKIVIIQSYSVEPDRAFMFSVR